MIELPKMLMVGAADRNAGKTEFACSIIRRFAGERPVTAVKVTTILKADGTCPRGGKGCGVCSSLEGNWCITEETDGPPDKDTTRLLEAGAERVYWVRVLRAHLGEALAALLETTGPDAVTVCESNSLRLAAEPALFLMVKEKLSGQYKSSARDVIDEADRVVLFDGDGFDMDLADLSLAARGWAMRSDATAVIMAGGDSSRMGRDKAMLPVAGRLMIEHVRDALRPHFSQILVSAADAGAYSFLGEEVIPDESTGGGPLVGIASALAAATYDRCFVVACDMPEVDVALMRRLLRASRDCDGAVPVTPEGRYEPLFAVYRGSALGAVRDSLGSGERRVRAFFGRCDVTFVGSAGALVNINTPEEYGDYTNGRDDSV